LPPQYPDPYQLDTFGAYYNTVRPLHNVLQTPNPWQVTSPLIPTGDILEP
jgi:hypothetical protein